jgi:hypothetical protein
MNPPQPPTPAEDATAFFYRGIADANKGDFNRAIADYAVSIR